MDSQLFQSLQDEWNNCPPDFNKRMEWNDNLESKWGRKFADDFFKWMDENMDNSLETYWRLPKEEFEDCLRHVCWD